MYLKYVTLESLKDNYCSLFIQKSPSDFILARVFSINMSITYCSKFIVTSLSAFFNSMSIHRRIKLIFLYAFTKFIQLATAISCYVCNSTDTTQPFECSEWFERYDRPDIQPVDCSAVHGAKYCVKHIGRFEGLRRFSLPLECGSTNFNIITFTNSLMYFN